VLGISGRRGGEDIPPCAANSSTLTEGKDWEQNLVEPARRRDMKIMLNAKRKQIKEVRTDGI